MLYSNLKFIFFSIIFSWFLTACDGEITITATDGSNDESARVTLESNLTYISNNGSVTLIWSVDNASNCVAIGDWSGNKPVIGSEVIDQLSENSTFTLSCMSEATAVSDTVIVYVEDVVLPTLTFSASSSAVNMNTSTILSWSTTDATECTASGDWSGSKAGSGSEVINTIVNDSTFNLSCSGPGGVVNDSVSVTVVADTTPTLSLTASPLSVAYNGDTILTWSSTNASSCSAAGDWSGSKATSGSETINALTANQVFTLYCIGSGGNAAESVNVTVQPAPAPSMSLSASATNVSQGGSTTLSWSSTNASSCTASGDWSGTKGATGSETINSITSDSQYVLDCSGAGGSVSDAIDVTVIVTPIPTVSLSSSPSTVSQGGSTTLSWNSTNATSCTASGDWSGSKGATGSETINSITSDSLYVLNCSGTGGSANASVDVTVVMSSNGTALLSWTPPTENTDGTTLTDLAGYRIYYGTESGSYNESVEIASPGLASYLIENLAPANWYFVMTSYNTANIESSYSEEVSKVIN